MAHVNRVLEVRDLLIFSASCGDLSLLRRKIIYVKPEEA